MKKLFIIMLSMLGTIGLSTQAQTKKTAPAKKTIVSNTKTTPTKALAKTGEQTEANKPAPKMTKPSKVNINSSSYKAALGLKFIYGVSLTGKFFLNEKSAIEGILRYNGAGGLGSNIAFTGLYEYYGDINSLQGLRWYAGGGGHVNHFSWKDGYGDPVTTFGVAGIVGLEYKFKGLPVAISADWQPAYIISNSVGFSAENGGIGIKYTF